jgi:hypothetical protein
MNFQVWAGRCPISCLLSWDHLLPECNRYPILNYLRTPEIRTFFCIPIKHRLWFWRNYINTLAVPKITSAIQLDLKTINWISWVLWHFALLLISNYSLSLVFSVHLHCCRFSFQRLSLLTSPRIHWYLFGSPSELFYMAQPYLHILKLLHTISVHKGLHMCLLLNLEKLRCHFYNLHIVLCS